MRRSVIARHTTETRIDLRLTHRELANIVGVTRETATRALSRLEADKLVIARDRSFLVPDPAKLLEDLD